MEIKIPLAQEKKTSMKVKVIGYARFKGLMGTKTPVVLEIEKGTLKDVLERLTNQYGKEFGDIIFDPQSEEEKRSNLILLNGTSHLNLRDRLGTELRDGDEIALLPVMVGG